MELNLFYVLLGLDSVRGHKRLYISNGHSKFCCHFVLIYLLGCKRHSLAIHVIGVRNPIDIDLTGLLAAFGVTRGILVVVFKVVANGSDNLVLA